MPLVGQAIQIDVAKGQSYTYFCVNCCESGAYSYATMLPGNGQAQLGLNFQYEILESGTDCNGNFLNAYVTNQAYNWQSTNMNVATVSSSGFATSVAIGSTEIKAKIHLPVYFYYGPGPCDGGGPYFAKLNCDASPFFRKASYTDYLNPRRAPEPSDCDCITYNVTRNPNANLTIVPPTVQVSEVGFPGDHLIKKWPSGPEIDPGGTTPTWKSVGNPNDPVAYTKEAMVTMFAKFTINPSVPNTAVKIRAKNGSSVFANKDISISGTTVTITDIGASSALETTVKTTTPTFTWEISYDGGTSWSSIGNSGPHTMYWTYDDPLSPPFRNDAGTTDPALYDLALQKATGYANGASDLGTIISSVNTGVDTDINYGPSISIGDKHPLEAYSTAGGCQCSDLANLLRGLLRSVGIDGTTLYIWAGPNTSELTRYTVGSTGNTNPSFRIIRNAHDSAGQDPHFKFHAVVFISGTMYDPSYGLSYSNLSFAETANNSTPQQISSSLWTSQPLSGFACPH